MKKLNELKVCIFGANGLVGGRILEVLDERYYKSSGSSSDELSRDNMILVATDRSVKIEHRSPLINAWELTSQLPLTTASDALAMKPDIVIMSAGAEASLLWAKEFTKAGAIVIDNSSAWRMDATVPLVIPGVSRWTIDDFKLIANPNCVATMVATAIAPLVPFGISKVAVTALQSVSGAGNKGLEALRQEEQDKKMSWKNIFPGKIYDNIIPASGEYSNADTPYNLEEEKGMYELHKIFLGESFTSSFRSFRVPVKYGHTASIRIKFKDKVFQGDVRNNLAKGNNIKYSIAPIMLEEVIGHDQCFVWGVRSDPFNDKVIELVAMSDNLRLGAASNAVSIMKEVIKLM